MQLNNLELKVDNANAYHQSEIEELKKQNQKLRMQLQEIMEQN